MNETTRQRLALWSHLWGGGLAWLLHFLSIWICAEFGCIGTPDLPAIFGISRVAWLVLILSVLFLGLAGAATLRSWVKAPDHTPDSPDAFLYRCGKVANPFFLFVIAVQTLPAFFYLNDCGNTME